MLARDSRCSICRPTVQDLFLRSSCGRLPTVAGGPGSPELGRGVGAGTAGPPPWPSEPCLTPRPYSFPRSSRPGPAAMKIAVIGQSLFGQEVYCHLREEGHEVVGVFTVPDKDGKADPLGEWVAQEHGEAVPRGRWWEQSLRGLVWGCGLPRTEAATHGPPRILLRCQLAAGLFWNQVDCRVGPVSWRRHVEKPGLLPGPFSLTTLGSPRPQHPCSEKAPRRESLRPAFSNVSVPCTASRWAPVGQGAEAPTRAPGGPPGVSAQRDGRDLRVTFLTSSRGHLSSAAGSRALSSMNRPSGPSRVLLRPDGFRIWVRTRKGASRGCQAPGLGALGIESLPRWRVPAAPMPARPRLQIRAHHNP